MTNSVERWDGLRLWVYRTRDGGMPAAVIMRHRELNMQHDVLLGRGAVRPQHRELALADPYAALLAALVQLRGPAIVQSQLMNILRAADPLPPLGGQGGDVGAP
jgi:hypothetical protein